MSVVTEGVASGMAAVVVVMVTVVAIEAVEEGSISILVLLGRGELGREGAWWRVGDLGGEVAWTLITEVAGVEFRDCFFPFNGSTDAVGRVPCVNPKPMQ